MKRIIIAIFLILNTPQIFAKDFLVQGRIFIANTKVSPDELNTALGNDGLEKIDKTNNLGVEITFPTFKYFEPGMRYTRRTFSAEENPSTSLTDYEASGTQNSILFLGRVPLFRSPFFRFDVFGGVGGNNTTINYKTAASDGKLSRSASGDWLATPYYATGASVGMGFKNIYLTIEGGYEANKVNKLQKSGTVVPNISTLNLSGSYFMIGLMFDGVRGFNK
jgi:hypothetical protein